MKKSREYGKHLEFHCESAHVTLETQPRELHTQFCEARSYNKLAVQCCKVSNALKQSRGVT